MMHSLWCSGPAHRDSGESEPEDLQNLLNGCNQLIDNELPRSITMYVGDDERIARFSKSTVLVAFTPNQP